jgi:DNA-directed RNA polymerase specialized sigma24 family protein
VGVDEQTLRRELRDARRQVVGAQEAVDRTTGEWAALIVEAYEFGLTYPEIAAVCGVTKGYVHRLAKLHRAG